MTKIQSMNELHSIRQGLAKEMSIREKSNHPEDLVQITVAMSTCGIAAGARQVMNSIVEKIEAKNIPAIVTMSGCMGYCYAEPTVSVQKPGESPVLFGYVNTEKAEAIIEEYILKGRLPEGITTINHHE